MELKMTLIGAGSVVFAKTLISDLLQFPELSHATICLMDIDPQRLKVAEAMTKRIIETLRVPAKVVATTDRRKAIQNARYVICTIQVGGYKPGTLIDFEIPKKYGLQQTIGDTLGIGGIFRALRTIPHINSIAQDIADLGAPGCLLLNYTNPMAMNCWAVDRAVGIPHVGLCHSVQGTSHQLSQYAQLNEKDISYLVAGINHMAFFLKFEYKKQDAYPLLFELLNQSHFKSDKVRFEMMRRTGYFVTESSEHQSEYVPYFIHHGKSCIDSFDIPIDEYLRRCQAIIRSWKDSEATLLGKHGKFTVPKQSHEYGSFIIHSRETNTPRVVYGNVPNRNLITNLPEGCCVEVPCLVDAQGIQPTHIGNLPPQLAALCQTNINVQSLTVEAALTQKREHIYHAAMLDPHTSAALPLDKIWSMCDDLIEAHQKVGLLSSFDPVIPQTGKPLSGTGDRIIAQVESLSALQNEDRKIPLQISVSNPRNSAVTVDLHLSTPNSSLQIPNQGKLQIKVHRRSKTQKTVYVSRLQAGNESLSFHLSSRTPDVFTKDTTVEPRGILSGKTEVSFPMNLAGFPAVEAKISKQKTGLQFNFRVLDSKVLPLNLDTPWSSSSLELFFATLKNPHPTQIFCAIHPKNNSPHLFKKQHGQIHKISGASGKLKRSSIDYRVEFFIPYPAMDLSEEESSAFLFDAYANIGALGDAHSGGRSLLNGKEDSHLTSRHFSMIEFK